MEQTSKTLSPIWHLAAAVMPALLYLSVGFSIFAPLPLLLYSVNSGLIRLILASLINAALLSVVGGWDPLVGYSIYVLSTVFGVVFPMRQLAKAPLSQYTMKKAMTWSFAGMTVMGLLWLAGMSWNSWNQGLSPLSWYQTRMDEFSNLWVQSVRDQIKDQAVMEEELKGIVVGFAPSVFAIFGVLMVFANLVMFFRINPSGILGRVGMRPSFFKEYKVSDYLVWPALASALIFLFAKGWTQTVSLNLLLILLSFYAIQGLSIILFFFDYWRLGPFLRILIFFVVFTSLWPALIGLGFFDLWFDFRKKVGQTS